MKSLCPFLSFLSLFTKFWHDCWVKGWWDFTYFFVYILFFVYKSEHCLIYEFLFILSSIKLEIVGFFIWMLFRKLKCLYNHFLCLFERLLRNLIMERNSSRINLDSVLVTYLNLFIRIHLVCSNINEHKIRIHRMFQKDALLFAQVSQFLCHIVGFLQLGKIFIDGNNGHTS